MDSLQEVEMLNRDCHAPYSSDSDLYRDNEYAYHMVNGLACGYPLCCVLHYCSLVDLFKTGNYDDTKDWRSHMGSEEGIEQNNIHALCPECMIIKLQTIKRCESVTDFRGRWYRCKKKCRHKGNHMRQVAGHTLYWEKKEK